MDALQKLGGRKFLMALIVIGAAIVLEIKTEKGLDTTMAGFLAAIVTAFGVTNYASTKEFIKGKKSGGSQEGVSEKLTELSVKVDELTTAASSINNQDSVQQLISLLNSINQGIAEVKGTTGQIGTAMVNVGKEVRKLSIGGNQ